MQKGNPIVEVGKQHALQRSRNRRSQPVLQTKFTKEKLPLNVINQAILQRNPDWNVDGLTKYVESSSKELGFT